MKINRLVLKDINIINNMRKSFKYNIFKLQELEIKLVKEFDEPEPKLNKNSLINGYCQTIDCSNTFNKSFQNILNKNGPYCDKCVKKNNNTTSTKQKYEWTTETLENLEIDLLNDYSNHKLTRASIIEGMCKTTSCNNTFSKTFEVVISHGGPFCDECVEENRRNKITETCKSKSKWTFQMLQDLNVLLSHDYSQQKLTRESRIEGICKNEDCSNTFNKSFGVILTNGGPYCTSCTTINQRRKMKETSIDKYGVENPFQSDIVKEKIKNTCLEKYGVERASQLEEVKEKMKSTCLEKYGVEWDVLFYFLI
jgi:hypothetical protein